MTTLALVLVVFVVLALFVWRAINRHLLAIDQFQELPEQQGNGLTPVALFTFDPTDSSTMEYLRERSRRRQQRSRKNKRRSAGGWSGAIAQ